MKKYGLLALLLFIGAVSACAQVFDFTLVHKTGYTIDQVFVSPSDDEEWGDDVLGDDVLENSDSWDITFDPDYEEIMLEYGVDLYDLKVVYEDESEDYWRDLKLETIYEITLKLDRQGNGVATFK